MKSIILETATRFLMPAMLLYSVFLLLRGHNLPGGGFVGGLMAAASFSLYAFAFSPRQARQLLRVNPRGLIGLGLLIALGSGSVSLVVNKPFMTGQWHTLTLAQWGSVKLGTPLLFDLGIYLLVLGSSLTMVLTMAERD
jgi:multicomponent Na+:H+ antiporter subunit B